MQVPPLGHHSLEKVSFFSRPLPPVLSFLPSHPAGSLRVQDMLTGDKTAPPTPVTFRRKTTELAGLLPLTPTLRLSGSRNQVLNYGLCSFQESKTFNPQALFSCSLLGHMPSTVSPISTLKIYGNEVCKHSGSMPVATLICIARLLQSPTRQRPHTEASQFRRVWEIQKTEGR